MGDERFAKEVLNNRQQTASENGILKADAAMQFAEALLAHRINSLQGLHADGFKADSLEEAVRRIPGQKSGISFRYFLMQVNRDDLIKPDRMVIRFLSDALGREVQVDECQELLTRTVGQLREKHTHLNPRLLDTRIWTYQRQQKPQVRRDQSAAKRRELIRLCKKFPASVLDGAIDRVGALIQEVDRPETDASVSKRKKTVLEPPRGA
jgi:hypothetical protein